MHEIEHTAEHIFIRSLQNLGKELKVRKVEHGDISKVYVECNDLTLDDIYKGEIITNNIINDNKEVKEYRFNSLDEAKMIFPKLRAYEERLSNKSIRVIEIDNYDYTACIKDHVKSTKECEFFMIKHISRENDLYRLEFLAGKSAKELALEFGITLLRIINDLKVSLATLEPTIKNMSKDIVKYREGIIKLSNTLLENMNCYNINGFKLYKDSFEMLDDKAIIKRIDKLKSNDIILISNKYDNKCNIILASKTRYINCAFILSSILRKFGGKGGGKEEMAMGSISIDKEEEILNILEEEIKSTIYKSNMEG
jgi:alanyl-tRNA synthetase